MKFSLVTILLLIFLSNANCQIDSVNSYLHINNSYLSLVLNPLIYYSFNYKIIRKNDIPKENISAFSGLNSPNYY